MINGLKNSKKYVNILNHNDFCFLSRSYSYYIEVSMDQKDWVRVVDHTKYLCRSWQELYFTPRVVRYIRIVGTYNTLNKVFHVVSLEAYYTKKPFQINKHGIFSKFSIKYSTTLFDPNRKVLN